MKKSNQVRWIERVFIGWVLLAVFIVFGTPMIQAHRDGKIVTSMHYQPTAINYNVAQLEGVK